MIFLTEFYLLDEIDEEEYIDNYYDKNMNISIYPFRLFPPKKFNHFSFDNITIFYGNNGSGKTTLLNLIAQNIKATRKSNVNFSRFFDSYATACESEMHEYKFPQEIKFISSNDVFDYLLDVQAINNNINRQKEDLAREYNYYLGKDTSYFYNDMDELRKKVQTQKQSQSKYIRQNMIKTTNIISQSNGETALTFFSNEITENGIYLLDEPENSLSPSNQIKLKRFIEDSVRFYNCQFIISTHSPFLLSLTDAKIYDLDAVPVTTKKFTELENIKEYIELFKPYIK